MTAPFGVLVWLVVAWAPPAPSDPNPERGDGGSVAEPDSRTPAPDEAPPVAAPAPSAVAPAAAARPPEPDPVVRPSRGDIIVDASSAPRPTHRRSRKVHGEARLGLSFGAVMQDPVATLQPAVELDLSEVAPLRLGISAPLRLRMADRAPDQDGVLRARDWDEVGDYLAIVSRVQYVDAFVFGSHGWVDVDLRAGELGRVQLGHGSIVRGYANSTDIDRRRTGLDTVARVVGRLLDREAGAELAVVAGDLAGGQILGARAAADWVGAGLGVSVVGDPTAPRRLARDPVDAVAVPRTRAGRLRDSGRRGVVALGTDVSYRATDDWRYVVVPYVDLVWMPGLGGGGHVGLDAELMFGRRRRARLGVAGELTLSGANYDPDYFDLFYLGQRWQMPTVGTADQRPTELGTDALPKRSWVGEQDLAGVGGGGAVRFAHAAGVFAELGYRFRPGPLGHTFESRLGLDLRPVSLSIVLAHRGSRHGFDAAREGTIARVDLRVPVIEYLDVIGAMGWLVALRDDVDRDPPPQSQTGLVTGAGFFTAGVAGRFPW